MLLADPLPIPSFIAISITGRKYFFTILAAIMPRTPSCQVLSDSLSDKTSELFLSKCWLFFKYSKISFIIFCSMSRLLVFMLLSDWASCLAVSRLFAIRSSTPVEAWSILPAAFNLGASLNATSSVSTVRCRRIIPLDSINVFMPHRLPAFIISSPVFTNMRFSSTRGTMSATVPRATRSQRLFRLGSGLFCQKWLSRRCFRRQIRR